MSWPTPIVDLPGAREAYGREEGLVETTEGALCARRLIRERCRHLWYHGGGKCWGCFGGLPRNVYDHPSLWRRPSKGSGFKVPARLVVQPYAVDTHELRTALADWGRLHGLLVQVGRKASFWYAGSCLLIEIEAFGGAS